MSDHDSMGSERAPATEARSERLATLLVRGLSGALTLTCLLWVIDVPRYLGLAFYREQFLAPVLGLALAVVFWSIGADGKPRTRVPWYDAIVGVVGLLTMLWVSLEYRRLLDTVVGYWGAEAVVIGVIVVALVLEGLRRTSGYTLLIVVVAFIAYAFVGDLIPGRMRALPIETDQFLVYLAFDPTAVFGSPMVIGAEVVLAYVYFGALLVKTGGGEFFTDIAMAGMGRTRGGAAKIAVVASGLFGSISGSATSNVVSTGVITIPLMRKAGYKAVTAGAVEAVASTGGQLMPPVMGAAAFLMAQFLEVPYSEVVIAAVIPAIIYYLAVFIQVDLVAAREGIKVVEDGLPRAREVFARGWHFLLPFAVLLVWLFEFNAAAEQAAIYACAVTIALGFLRRYRDKRLTVRGLIDTLWETGKTTVDLFMIMAAAGFVIGILNVTGLGFALTFYLVQLGGSNLMLLLAIAAVTSIILGMGMPTTGVYVLLASLIAPGLIEAGLQPMSAHMFIFYFGMMSMITPPVALAAFAAAGLTKASAMQTGFVAMRLGWTAFIIPFLFALSPTLLMYGEPASVAFNFVTALGGVYLISCAVEGYFVRPMGAALRILVGLAGFAALTPAQITPGGEAVDIAGLVIGAALLVRERMAVRRVRLASAE